MRRPFFPALAAVALVSLVAAAAVSARPAAKQDSVPIIVGSQPLWLSAPLYLAQDKGYWEAQGLSVSVIQNVASPARFAAVLSGSMQFIDCPLVTLLQGLDQGFQYTLVAPLSATRSNVAGLLVKKDSAIRSLKDVEGKSVGIVTPHGQQELNNRAYLSAHGVDTSKVTYSVIPSAGMADAVLQGRIDVGDLNQPFLDVARSTGQFRQIGDDSLGNGPYGVVNDYYCTSTSYLQQHPDIAKKFVAALMKANRWAATHPRDAKAELPKANSALSAEAAQATPIGAFPSAINLKDLQRAIDLAVKFAFVEKRRLAKDIVWAGAPITPAAKKK